LGVTAAPVVGADRAFWASCLKVGPGVSLMPIGGGHPAHM
jgi:hypothetical protein